MFQFIKNNKEIYLLVFLQFLMLIFLSMRQLYFQNESIGILYAIIVVIIQLVSCFLIYRLLKNIFKSIEEEKKKQLWSMQRDYQEEHARIKKYLDNQLEKTKLQMNDKLKMITSGNLNEDEYHKLIEDALKECEKFYQVDFCEQKVVDAILYNKTALAKASEIEIDIQVQLPEILAIKNVDLICIFANLLDNAIEANTLLSKEERFIKLTSVLKMNQVIIKVENAKSRRVKIEQASGKTTKTEEKELHGFGLKIIQRTAEKYNGNFTIKDEGNVAIAVVCMENNENRICNEDHG